MKTGLLVAAAALLAVDLSAQGRVQRPMTFADFAAVRNVGDPQVSPDGRWVLYSLRTTDVGANRRTTVTRLQPAAGGPARQFPDANTTASEARWSPDGKRVAYVSAGQLWIADATGANARRRETESRSSRASIRIATAMAATSSAQKLPTPGKSKHTSPTTCSIATGRNGLRLPGRICSSCLPMEADCATSRPG
jgi:dipeptidyl aminopeptidase/acylaminoacyl peptidase